MYGETLNHSLLNAREQLIRAEAAVRLVRDIEATFIGPRVDALDPETLSATRLLAKLLRDDAEQAKQYIRSIEGELAKRRVPNVA